MNSLITATTVLPVRAFPHSVKARPRGYLLSVFVEVLDELPWLPSCHTSFSVLQQLGSTALYGTASGVSCVPPHVQGCRCGA